MKYIEIKSEGYTYRYDFEPVPSTAESLDIYLDLLSLTRSAALGVLQKITQSSAYRTNGCPRFSNSLSSSLLLLARRLVCETSPDKNMLFPPYACRIYPHVFRMTIGL